MPNVTLYQMPQVVQLTDIGADFVSTVQNRTDFKLYKNVSNQIEFLFKTVDRKPVSYTIAPVLYVVDERTETLVIQQSLIAIDTAAGHYRLLLDQSQLFELDNGYFRYSITTVDDSGNQFVVYTDQNRSLQGHLELYQGPIPAPQPMIEIPVSEFVSTQWGNPLSTFFRAQSYPGAAARNNHSGMQTLAIYMTNFSGTFAIEASLENSAPTSDTQWFPVTQTSYVSASGVKSILFTGNYLWLRFYFQPQMDNNGSIDKVLLKN